MMIHDTVYRRVYLFLVVGVGLFAATGWGDEVEQPRHHAAVAASYAAELPTPDTPLHGLVWVSFDTETTGLSPRHDRIIELGAARYVGLRKVAEGNWLLNPQHPISYHAENVHGITQADLEGAPTFEEIYPEFAALTEGAILLAHNARFDVQFMAAEIERAGYPMPPHVTVDTLQLFRRTFHGLASYRLEYVANVMGVSGGEFHRALDDAFYVADVYRIILRQLGPYATLREIYENAGNLVPFDSP